MINWMYFPKNQPLDAVSQEAVKAFQGIDSEIDSETHHYKNDEVLAIVRPGLEAINFMVEKSNRSEDLVAIVLIMGWKLSKRYPGN
ncbi:MAG: hypothetical protein K6G83_01300 [Lachnospiraceae bacterium]|nr:hypothetical protein [Lachnospiraceae bacterium]